MPSIQGKSAFGSGSRTSHVFSGHSRASPGVTLPLDRLRGAGGHDSRTASESSFKISSVDISDKESPKAAAKAPAPAASTPAPAPADRSAASVPGGTDWRDAFKVAKGTVAKKDSSNPSMFRAAVEAERWRSKLSGESRGGKDKDDKLDSYRQPAQADWARERLLGVQGKSDEEREEEELEVRVGRVVAQAWRADASHWMDTVLIDRLEETLRRRLGELETNAGSAHAGRASRAFFAECDPQRQGRVLLTHFVNAMARKLNYDFPARHGAPGAHDVLEALFRRYDVERTGVIAADDFHAALTGASRAGRASGRVVNALGRLREGLVRHAGGYDALRAADARWFRASEALGLPTGCLTAGAFVDELLELGRLCETSLSEADLVTLLDTFEPPAEAYRDAKDAARKAASDASDPLVSFDEVTLALRGPPMGSARVAIARAAYAALKDDAKVGLKSAVKPAHLADRFDASKHPAVLAGNLTEEEAAMGLLRVWTASKETLDTEVTIKEFCDRYEWISTLYDDDKDFDAMMRAAWRLK